MELISGITKEDCSDYIIYFIEELSDELKQEIRNRSYAEMINLFVGYWQQLYKKDKG